MPKPGKKIRKPTSTIINRRSRRWFWALLCCVVLVLAVFLIYKKSSNPSSTKSQEQNGAPLPDATVFATYAGSDSCRACHESEFDRWSTSHHGLAERPLDLAKDRPAFDPPRTFHHGTRTSQALLSNQTPEVITDDRSRAQSPQKILRVIGVDPLRQFLVAGEGGRLQALEVAYDPNQNQWFDVYGNEDRHPGEWGHWTGRGMTWNSMCATCHNTRVRKNYDQASDTYHTAMAQMSVSCESCHGPMASHVQWERKYNAKGGRDPNLHPLSNAQMVDTCGSCHARRGDLTGDFVPGDSFFDHYMLDGVDASDTFYPDGQIHDEDYELSAFLGSKMHAAGVRCVDCHDPHSGKTLLVGNALCMRCHVGAYPKAPIIDPLKHTFHRPDSAGSQCINCHMPQTIYMQRHGRHDHGFTTPDPLLTLQLGIPNACNRCHADKSADWANENASKWYGAKLDRPARHRAMTIAAARKGEDSARPGLLALMSDATQPPYWKAACANLLAPWVGREDVRTALLLELKAPDPLERASAVRALGALIDQAPVHSAIQTCLSDPARNVRISAANALQQSIDPNSSVGKEFLRFLALQSDQPTGQLQEANYFASRGQNDVAIQHLRTAENWDSGSASLRREIAMTFSALGHSDDAATELEAACQLDPKNAEYPYLLGLAYAELGQTQKAIDSLRSAVRLDPHHARAWYNLALALRNKGDADGALGAFTAAEAADPNDADIPYARATLLLQLNRPDEAQKAAQRALQIQPGYGPALDLIRSFSK